MGEMDAYGLGYASARCDIESGIEAECPFKILSEDYDLWKAGYRECLIDQKFEKIQEYDRYILNLKEESNKSRAEARLIAAAPELFDLVKQFLHVNKFDAISIESLQHEAYKLLSRIKWRQ